ncbi:hypothetical protein [Acetobacter nitrogenifigens]|nr:hypothetical protein [Acetobacter nitrogenifigens]
MLKTKQIIAAITTMIGAIVIGILMKIGVIGYQWWPIFAGLVGFHIISMGGLMYYGLYGDEGE